MAAAAAIVLVAWFAEDGSHGRRWVVADRSLAAGVRISAADLRTETMTLPADAAADAFASPETLVGRTLSAPLQPGELVESSLLVPAGHAPLLRPVTVSVTPADANDLSAGTLVDVLETSGSGPSARTAVVLRGARVMSLGKPTSGVFASSSGTEVTLGVRSLAEVEAIVAAEHAATVSVVVGEPSDGAGLGPPAGPGAKTTGATANGKS